MSTVVKDLGPVTAYADAVAAGYTGTKEEWQTLMASYASVAEEAQEAKEGAEAAQDAAEDARDAAISAKTGAESAVSGFGTVVTQATNQAVQTVRAEGTTQVGNVSSEGTTQVAAVQAKGTEVIQSIPADYTQLSSDVTQLKEDLSPFLTVGINLLDLNAITNGVYISNTNGSEVAYASWSASDYMPIETVTTYRVLYLSNNSYVRATGQNLYWAVYNNAKEFVRGGVGDGINTAGAVYLRVSCPTSYYSNSIMVVTDADASNITTGADYEPYTLSSEPFVEKVDDAIEDISELQTVSINTKLYTSSDSGITTGFIKYWNGEVDTSGMSRTDYLDVSSYQGMLLIVKARKPVGNDSGLAFYDDDKSFIQGVDYDDAGNTSEVKAHEIRVQVPKNATYLRASTSDAVKDEFAVLLDIEHMADNIYQHNPLFVSDDVYWVNFNPTGTKVSLSDAWKTNAEQAYNNMQDYLKATNAYDFASLLIETDSHGRGTLPFNWMQKHDNSVRCCHLGDIVDDYYNPRELEYYYENTKECEKLITIVGNHDAHYNANGGQGNQYDLIRCLNGTDRRMADQNGCFSVIDYDQRIKYICLNPYQITTGGEVVAITTDQMHWFVNELETAQQDVVVLSHNAINDTSLVDRDGNSGSAYIGGPYAVGYDQINALLKAFKNKSSGTISTSTYGDIVYDFTNVNVDLICNLAGHTHHELFKMDTYLTYVANWYGNTHCCVFFVADKVNKKVALFQFDNSTVYSMLELNY